MCIYAFHLCLQGPPTILMCINILLPYDKYIIPLYYDTHCQLNGVGGYLFPPYS